jgi:formylglycine-generating enzyme required for sulfatase activity
MFAITSVAVFIACDDDENGIVYQKQTFPIGEVTWKNVSESDKAVITELINNMVKVESTLFYMGAQLKSTSKPNYYAYSTSDTATWVGPVITVSMPDYYIGRYEVTQGEWKAVMGDVLPTGRYCKIPEVERNAPWYAETGLADTIAAYNISYDDAVNFCESLNAKTGLNFHLPTEAQWECAARGGRYCQGYRFIGSDDYTETSWCYSNACAQGQSGNDYGVHRGGRLKANELGLYDMSGNVAEWVQNSYYKYSSADTINPPLENPRALAGLGDTLILRGGSWTQQKSVYYCPANRRKFIRSSYSSEESLHSAIAYCGFRLAL